MKIIGLLVAVYVTGGNVPGVELVARNYMPLQECKAQAEKLNAMPSDEPIRDGKPVLMVRYACTVQDAGEVIEQAESLK
ncbi:hypothetical protein [Mesorhizobium sp.]|uniref:hypothetical protein n=1 Tax=Mesorhizobium sp. TaxID=1871066 RepID=UPI000FE333A5|nr:hypothetical protein [Mesorhizobium sp.]RWI35520.1 MAG: hypothetical protein EOR14_28880 [Mesorhizobium sp.]RWJ03456.1 MAG: hypothetical protein EOR24_32260 [Mesorhizobium sp.]RWJ66311.1 MAG: hypothetical protein EOR34_28255 [Mesorhizobium sp.]